MSAPLHTVVLAAGEGRRLRGNTPKVLIPLWGRPSLAYPVIEALKLGPERVVVVGGEHLPAMREALKDEDGGRVAFAHQPEPRGTGDAVLRAIEELPGGGADPARLLILYGDCPLVTSELLSRLLAAHAGSGASLTMLTASLDDPTGYGRVVRGQDGDVEAVVEEADADDETKAITEINTGVWVVELPEVLADLRGLGSDNAQGEVYLTDLVEAVLARGGTLAAAETEDPSEVLGFNDQLELSLVRRLLRDRILGGHMDAGVEIVDPDSTYIDADVTIEAGARILPCTVIEGKTSIAGGCEVGPFSHLRTGTVLEAGAEVGNFTETKKSVIGPGSKAKHLTYLGDTTIGAGTNIGAGTITANYDGKHKHVTRIGDRAFVGSGSVIVAPASLEDESTTGAGAVVTRDSVIKKGEVWVGVPARPLKKRQPSGRATR